MRSTLNLSSSKATQGLCAISICPLSNQFSRIAWQYASYEGVDEVVSIVVIAFTAEVKSRTLETAPPNAKDGGEATFGTPEMVVSKAREGLEL